MNKGELTTIVSRIGIIGAIKDGALDELIALGEQTNADATRAEAAASSLSSQQSMIDEIELKVNDIPTDPANGLTSWELTAKAFDLAQGVPVYKSVSSRVSGWSMPPDTAAYLSTIIALPSHWHSMDVYIKWVNEAANTGNVVLGAEIHQWKTGDNINASPAGGSGIMPANATPGIVVESKAAADLVLDPAKLTTLRIARQGASANDTLVNSNTIISVRLVKKS